VDSTRLGYYKRKERKYNTELENRVIQVFKDSKNNYGTRKIGITIIEFMVL
jgi:hypothetical protein